MAHLNRMFLIGCLFCLGLGGYLIPCNKSSVLGCLKLTYYRRKTQLYYILHVVDVQQWITTVSESDADTFTVIELN